MQVTIVQLGGEVFHTRPLTGGQWGACVGIRARVAAAGGGCHVVAQPTRNPRRVKGLPTNMCVGWFHCELQIFRWCHCLP